MKRYLLFAGDDYYPAGGWGDFKGDFDTKDDAMTYYLGLSYHYDWQEIVDTETKEVEIKRQ